MSKKPRPLLCHPSESQECFRKADGLSLTSSMSLFTPFVLVSVAVIVQQLDMSSHLTSRHHRRRTPRPRVPTQSKSSTKLRSALWDTPPRCKITPATATTVQKERKKKKRVKKEKKKKRRRSAA